MTDTEISALARKMMLAEDAGVPISRWKAKLYLAIAEQIHDEADARKEAIEIARRVA